MVHRCFDGHFQSMARDTTDLADPFLIELGAKISDELVAYLAAGNKPRDKWRIGTEHEKFPFYVDGNAPVPYGGDRGIRALLEGMQKTSSAGIPILDAGRIIGLVEPTGQGAISWSRAGSSSFPARRWRRSTRPAARATRIWRSCARSPSRSASASSASAAARNGRWPKRRKCRSRATRS
jgi:hypothetical protein